MRYSINLLERWRRLTLQDAILALFLMMLAWLPFSFGGVSSMSKSFLVLTVGVLLCLSALADWRNPSSKGDASIWIQLSAIGFAGVIGWAFIQTVSWTPADWHSPAWTLLDGTEIAKESRITIHTSATFDAITMLLTAAGVFWLSYRLCGRNYRARLLLLGIVIISAAYALIGLWMMITDWAPPGRVTVPDGIMTSTFFNRNHYATYANLGFVTALALIFAKPGSTGSSQVRLKALWIRVVAEPIERVPLRTLAALLCLVGVLASQSRGGFLSLSVALVLLLLLERRRNKEQDGAGTLITTLVFIAIVTFLLVAIGQPLLSRFDELNELNPLGGGRIAAWQKTIELIRLEPWTGYGLGTYADLFLMHIDERFTKVFDHAHNDYLEIVAELGIPAAAAFFLAVLLLVMRCAQGTGRLSWQRRRIALAGLLSSAVVGVHATVDFSLAIPAVSTTYAAILGAACAQCDRTRKESTS